MEYASALRAAARSLGIQTAYQNNEGQVVWAPAATLIQLCSDLCGITPLNKQDSLRILTKKSDLIRNKMPASIVAWGHKLKAFHLHLENEKQLETDEGLAELSRELGMSLYMDYPVGESNQCQQKKIN